MIRLACQFPVVAVAALAALQGLQPVQTDVAWHGEITSPSFSEVSVHATANGERSIAVEVADPDLPVRADMMLRNGESLTASLPVVASNSTELALRYSVDSGPWQEIPIGRLREGDRQTVLAGESAVRALNGRAGTTIVPPSDLPRLPAAYTHIEALVLGSAAFARLDEWQLQAILEFAGWCGRILLIDPPASVERLVSQRAACGSRSIAIALERDALAVYNELISSPVEALPGERSIRRLLGERRADVRLLTIFLAGFLGVYIVLIAMPRSRSVAHVFSITMATLAVFLWGGGSNSTLVAWAETTTNERVARYASIERASALGRGEQTLQLQSLARSPLSISGDSLRLWWDDVPGNRHVEWKTTLLQEMHVFAAGSFPVESRLRASTNGKDVVVCNRSSGSAPSAYLRWKGINYTVPPLDPGQRWLATEDSITKDRSAHLRLLAQRAAGPEPAILYPLEISANGADKHAWLMSIESSWSDESCSA